MTIPAPAAASRAATDWPVVVALVGAGAVAVMQLGKPAPALSLIRADLGLDLVTAGWVSSIVNLFGAAAGGIAGFLADRTGRRRAMIAALLCLTVGALGVAAAPSALVLLSARFLEGVGLVMVFVAGTPLIIAAAAARDRALVLGIWAAFFPLGLGLIAAAAGGLLTTVGWRGFFAANTVLCAATLFAFVAIVGRARVAADAPSSLGGAGAALRRPGPWLLGAIFLVMSVATFAVQTWLPTFLFERLGLSIAEAALASAAFLFLFIPANVLGGRACDAGPVRRWHVLAGGSVGIALVPFGIFAEGLGDLSRALVACLYPLSAGLIPGAVFAGIPVHTRTPGETGVVSGLISQGSFIGNLAGPPLLGFLVLSLGGWTGAVWMFPALGAACLAVALAIGAIEARH